MDCSESKFSSDRHRKPALLGPGSVSRAYPCWHLCLEEPSSSVVPHAVICAWKNPAAPWFPLGAAVSALLSGPSQGPSCLGAVPSQLSRGVMADAEDRTL